MKGEEYATIPLKDGLRWSFDGSGEWAAPSKLDYQGFAYQWRVVVCEDGTFDVSESDRPLADGRKETFTSLEAAKEWCDETEDKYVAAMAAAPER